jgi:hypothetical protein
VLRACYRYAERPTGDRWTILRDTVNPGMRCMPSTVNRTVIALCLAGMFATPASALPLFGPNCLETLTERTHIWAECNGRFGASNTRCKSPKTRMHHAMQKCEHKGYSKTEIDAAMAAGYRSAGTREAIKPATETKRN